MFSGPFGRRRASDNKSAPRCNVHCYSNLKLIHSLNPYILIELPHVGNTIIAPFQLIIALSSACSYFYCNSGLLSFCFARNSKKQLLWFALFLLFMHKQMNFRQDCIENTFLLLLLCYCKPGWWLNLLHFIDFANWTRNIGIQYYNSSNILTQNLF